MAPTISGIKVILEKALKLTKSIVEMLKTFVCCVLDNNTGPPGSVGIKFYAECHENNLLK